MSACSRSRIVFPNRLKIQMHALVTRVLLDGGNVPSASSIRAANGCTGAHPRQNTAAGKTKQVFAAREVILAGGAFNTPQVLMLSGIGPRGNIEKQGLTCVEWSFPVLAENLQDRYEVAVVNRMSFTEWEVLEGATFTRADPRYQRLGRPRDGVYATNGTVLSVVTRSGPAASSPDLVPLLGGRPVRRVLPGVFVAARAESQLPDMDRPQGAHQ